MHYHALHYTNTIIVILSHKKKNRKITYGALIGNYGKVSFVLGMYVLLNQLHSLSPIKRL